MVDKTVADLNPRSHPVKDMEMTVKRGMQIIQAFDALEKGEDWQDVPSTMWRKILTGPRYRNDYWLEVMWQRYKDKTLHGQVLGLHANLPPNIWKPKRADPPKRKKELKGRRDGIDAIRETFDSRRKRRHHDSDDRRGGKTRGG